MAIVNYLKELKEQKKQLAANITVKGVQANESETFNTLVPKVLQIQNNTGTTPKKSIFHYGMPDKYGDTIFTVFQNGIQNLDSYVRNGKAFCCADNQYTICYTQSDFSWDGHVYTASTEPIIVDENTAVVMTYMSGVTEKGEMYLIPADGKADDDTIQNYIYTSVFNGNRYEQKFWWLDCSEFISHLIPCRVSAPGNYYLCWLGRSDNTHPVISDITVVF
ncbi:MAG: hypothetical protein MSH15_11210 [Oscillospiraceae bacterium]|nr:hypothetical protein [Oscillospiraceae bacterium]